MQRPQTGFVLLASMAVLAGMVALTGAALARSATELLAANRSIALHQAFHWGEAGVDLALHELNADWADFRSSEGWVVAAPGACPAGSCFTRAYATPGGTLSVVVEDAYGSPRVLSTATLPGAPPSAVAVHLKATAEGKGFRYAAFAGTDGIVTWDFGVTDSYSSAEGYDPLTARARGDLGTNMVDNSQNDFPFTVSPIWIVGSGAVVNGSAYMGPGADLSAHIQVWAPAQLDGDRRHLPLTLPMKPVVMAAVTCDVEHGDALALPAGPVELGPGIHCANKVRLDGPTAILSTTGKAELYVRNWVLTSNGATIRPLDDAPGNLQIHLAKGGINSVNEIGFAGGGCICRFRADHDAEVAAVLYGPDAWVRLESDAQFFGAIAADHVEFGDGAALHYDEDLRLAETRFKMGKLFRYAIEAWTAP